MSASSLDSDHFPSHPATPTAPPAAPPAGSDRAVEASAERAVPPPPPPSAAPAPVRKPAQPRSTPQVRSGVGSAKGVRWKGELEPVTQANEEKDASEKPHGGESQYEDLVDETIQAAPAWLISLVIHLIVLLALALIASPAGRKISRVVLSIGEAEPRQEVEFAEFSVSEEIDADGELEETMVDVPVEIPVPELETVFDAPTSDSLAPVDIGLADSTVEVQPMVSGRSGAMKRALLAAYGGTEATEDAVQLGLKWLAKQQQRDGSWNLSGPYSDGAMQTNKAAATAMALLAFQGAGHTHQSGEYAEHVKKGITYLIRQQDREGFFAGETRHSHSKMYSQAQAMIAICELYAMTKDSWLREPAQRSVAFAEAAQSSLGGWRYVPREGADLSVTGWFVMGLESARAGGLEVDRQVLYRVDEYLNTVQFYEGSAYAYQPHDAPSPAMTAEGILCRQYLGWHREKPAMREAVETIVSQHNFDIEDQHYYYWYYATQVLHHYGGDPWRKWNYKMRVELPAAQVQSGREAGSWSPQGSRWGSSGGRLYTTCLAIYCLEVYYRHLPLYSPKQ